MSIEQDDTAAWAFPAVQGSSSWSTCPDENLLSQLAEGKLQGPDRADIDRHLDTCADCTLLVGELARLAAPARSAPKRYQVIRQLGAGAMGVVWEAEDTNLHRRVALKFVKPEGADDGRLRKRLLREARALAQVRHPNVVSVYDAGEADDEVCLVLELVTGTNARAWRAAKPRTTAEIVNVWKQAAAGLAAVHKAGIVHRDIKPDNVFVSEDGRVLVGDFGLATGGAVGMTTSLTVSGAVIGTPLYMSPEQLQGDVASVKSDQFALCASFWEAIVDERPFRGTTIAAIVLAMTRTPEIPKGVTAEQRRVLAVLQRGLDPEPDARFPDLDALIAALDRPAKRSRAPLWIALGAVVLAAGTTAAVLAATRSSSSEASPAPAPPPTATTPAPTPGSPPPRAEGSATPGHPEPAPPPGPGSAIANQVAPSKPDAPRPDAPRPDAPRPAIAKQVAPSPPVPAPTPGAPKPEPTPAKPEPKGDGTFSGTLMRAADRLAAGDGAGCLKLIAQLPEVPSDSMVGVEQIKINCRMATGDCTGGAAAMQAFGKKQGWDEGRIKTASDAADRAYCPITSEPRSRWGERAQFRLTVAASRGSCRGVLETIKKHDIALPDPKGAAFMEVQCMVNVGDCAGARAKYIETLMPPNLDPTRRPDMEEAYARSFHGSYKKCPP
jgi:serine/threonine protein kinase